MHKNTAKVSSPKNFNLKETAKLASPNPKDFKQKINSLKFEKSPTKVLPIPLKGSKLSSNNMKIGGSEKNTKVTRVRNKRDMAGFVSSGHSEVSQVHQQISSIQLFANQDDQTTMIKQTNMVQFLKLGQGVSSSSLQAIEKEDANLLGNSIKILDYPCFLKTSTIPVIEKNSQISISETKKTCFDRSSNSQLNSHHFFPSIACEQPNKEQDQQLLLSEVQQDCYEGYFKSMPQLQRPEIYETVKINSQQFLQQSYSEPKTPSFSLIQQATKKSEVQLLWKNITKLQCLEHGSLNSECNPQSPLKVMCSQYNLNRNRKLELICLDCKQIVCDYCAIFGNKRGNNHKIHEMIGIERLINDLDMLKMLELDKMREDIKMKLASKQEKKGSLISPLVKQSFEGKKVEIKSKFEELFLKLRENQKDVYEKLEAYYLQIDEQIQKKENERLYEVLEYVGYVQEVWSSIESKLENLRQKQMKDPLNEKYECGQDIKSQLPDGDCKRKNVDEVSIVNKIICQTYDSCNKFKISLKQIGQRLSNVEEKVKIMQLQPILNEKISRLHVVYDENYLQRNKFMFLHEVSTKEKIFLKKDKIEKQKIERTNEKHTKKSKSKNKSNDKYLKQSRTKLILNRLVNLSSTNSPKHQETFFETSFTNQFLSQFDASIKKVSFLNQSSVHDSSKFLKTNETTQSGKEIQYTISKAKSFGDLHQIMKTNSKNKLKFDREQTSPEAKKQIRISSFVPQRFKLSSSISFEQSMMNQNSESLIYSPESISPKAIWAIENFIVECEKKSGQIIILNLDGLGLKSQQIYLLFVYVIRKVQKKYLKAIKLSGNFLTNQGFNAIVGFLGSVNNLNLSKNMLSEQILDVFIANRDKLSPLRIVNIKSNKIKVSKMVRDKIAALNKMGMMVHL